MSTDIAVVFCPQATFYYQTGFIHLPTDIMKI